MPSRHPAARPRSLAALAAVTALAACADPQSLTAPDVGRPVADVATASATGPVVQRSLEEFLAAQGTVCTPEGGTFPDGTPSGCVSFLPWIADIVGFCDDPNEAGLSVCLIADYAGIANRQLGDRASTQFTGSIRERVLPDGRALISGNLNVRNAVTYAVLVDFEAPNGQIDAPTIFGYQLPELLADPSLEPTYGNVSFRFAFIMPEPGMPLPDFVQFYVGVPEGMEFISMTYTASAFGPLRAGSGYADGTWGRMGFMYADRLLHWQGPREPRFKYNTTPIRIQPVGR